MTNEELKKLIARAIANGSPDLNETAQAVIDALTPMMRAVAWCLAIYANRDLFIGSYYPSGHSEAEKTIASLPECWREKGGDA